MPFPPQEHIAAAQFAGEFWYDHTGFYSFPSFRLAQTGIESANGTAISGANNFWGVKANKAQIAAGEFKECLTHEVIKGKTIRIKDKFASYQTLEDGYIKQAELLVTSKLYEKSRHDTNPEQYAIDVGHVYATAPNYAKIVIDYMRRNNLTKYDHPEHKPIETVALRPPLSEEKKAQAPANAGVAVALVTTTTVAAVPDHLASHVWIVAAVFAFALLCTGFAFWRYRKAQAVLQDILTPPTPAEIAELQSALVRSPLSSSRTLEAANAL